MKSGSVFNRRSRSRTFLGFWFSFIFCCAITANADLPADAPILISEADSTRALTATPTKRGLGWNTKIYQPGSRVTFFVTNLDLLKGESASAFRTEIEDAMRRRFKLQIESIAPIAERPWVYALTVRLDSEVGDAGEVLVRLTWRGVASNRVRLAIGHEGGGAKDDPGSVPTPMPEKPVVGATVEANRVGPQFSGDRIRFMQQATFGATNELDARLKRIGFSTWLAEQTEQKLDANGNPRYSSLPYPTLPLMPTDTEVGCSSALNRPSCIRTNYTMYPLQTWFNREALYGEDQQLRRRVSWALSQIFVVSGRETVQPSRILPYIQILDKHAFGNFRDLLHDITLNPAMGNYLDMVRSTATNPNENYAREILQLFSVGLEMLNQDGTPMLDADGNRIPTYDQNIVNGFTKVFTGWTFCNVGCPNSVSGAVNYRDPMILIATNHDTEQKTVLSYPGAVSVIPAGQTADQDFNQALDNIFYHPNVAPFVSKLLIQQLVTSNPTPAYIERVAAVFNDNGAGIRGDMKAVVRAILLDPEARGNVKTDPDYGHLKEPVLFVTNILRPFYPTANNNATPAASCNGQSDGILNGITSAMDQDVFNAPTVFNYYPFDYTIPNTNLAGPEFAIMTTGTTLKRPNFVNQMVFGLPPANNPNGALTAGIPIANAVNPNSANYVPCGTRINLTNLQQLAQSDSTGEQLVEALNKLMLNGSMSPQVRGDILIAVQAVAPSNSLKRAQTAFYLIATSSQFQVQR